MPDSSPYRDELDARRQELAADPTLTPAEHGRLIEEAAEEITARHMAAEAAAAKAEAELELEELPEAAAIGELRRALYLRREAFTTEATFGSIAAGRMRDLTKVERAIEHAEGALQDVLISAQVWLASPAARVELDRGPVERS